MDQNQQLWAQMINQAEAQTAVTPISSYTSNFQRSEGTGVLHINMNSHDNQGTLIGIPIFDLASPVPHLYFYDAVMEVDAYFKTQNGETASRTRRLLSSTAYDLSNPEDKEKYEKLRNDFTVIYKNRDMLTKTDWISCVKNPPYFGFYMWVISHTNAQNQQITDKSEQKIPHCGAQREGRLAFIQFKGSQAFSAWQQFLKSYEAIGQGVQVVYPRLFGRDGFRPSALMINYAQDQSKPNKPFVASFVEKGFADPAGLATLVNDRGANPNAYHILPEWIEAAKDINKEFINTDAEILFQDAHIFDFGRALKGVMNCFDFYQACGADSSDEGKQKYDQYVESCAFNESSQAKSAEAAQQAAGLQPGQIPNPVIPGSAPGVPSMPAAPAGNPVMPGVPQAAPAQTPSMPGMIPGVPTAPTGNPTIPSAPVMPGTIPTNPTIPGGFPPGVPTWGAGNQ